MFNWFKSKVELKKETSIMSSFYTKKGLKLGSEISVPNNFQCLIFHNDKCYNTLESGKYKMDKKTFNDLIERQQRRKSNKYIKCVCHYVNLSPQKIELKFKKQIYLIEFKIEHPINFAPLALLYNYKVDNDYILSTLTDVFYELLLHYKGDYNQIKSDALNNYGINIIGFVPNNNKKSIFATQKSANSMLAPSPQLSQQDEINQQNITTEKSNNKLSYQSSSKSQISPVAQEVKNISKNKQNPASICPQCNNIVKFNTTYCLRCGYKLQ